MPRVLAIGLLLTYSLRLDLGRIPHPQLEVQLRQKSLKPACVSTGFHAHPHLHTTRGEIAIKLFRFLRMRESLFLELTCLSVHKSNLLEARVIVTTYNGHVRLLSPGLGWLAPPKSTRGSEPT